MSFRCVMFLGVVCWAGALVAQTAGGGSVAAVTATTTQVSKPSVILQPGLDVLKQAVAAVRVDKWKGPSTVKEETDRNVGSMRRDLNETLPGLLAAADAAPDSVAKGLPAYRNVEALYDVLLRVDSVARVSAPAEQSSALDQAVASLDSGRRSFGDQLQTSAVAGEKRLVDLQASLKAAQATPVAAAPAPVCPATPPVKKKAKPAAKPVAPPPSASQ